MDYGYFKELENEEVKDKFVKFLSLLLFYNEKFNLTSICDEKEVFLKHFYDSILPKNHFKQGAKVVEVGSGAGFPSIPLKIVRDDLSFTLIESTGKKCAFLQEVVDKLSLNCVQVKNIRAEDAGKGVEFREKFDICTARAVARLNTLCEYCLPLVKVGGNFIAYKGDCDEEIEESLSAVKILGGKIKIIDKYELPSGGGKRTAVVIEKVCATPLKYPRGKGLERKKPL